MTCSRPQRKAPRLRIEPGTSGTGVNHSTPAPVRSTTPRNRGVSTAFLSYLLRTCDVCVAYHGLSFRIYGVSAMYVWHISRIDGVCATYVSLLWCMCDVLGVLGIFCGVPRES